MQLHFQKMQGAGNKITIVDQRVADAVVPDEAVLQALRDAVPDDPFDQLMWLSMPRDPSSAVAYRVFNLDGSEVEQCGNGARCVAVLLASQDDVPRNFCMESPAGPVRARVADGRTASIDMGPPVFDDSHASLVVDGMDLAVGLVSMGNPHCVLDVDDVNTAAVERLGPALERHELFPARTNVGFMQIVDRENIRLRVFERGVGETLACGTGACAAAALGMRRGQLDDEVNVHLPGGQLMVSWPGADASVWLTGDVEFISEGTIDL